MSRPLYLQLWSLRRETESNPEAVLRRLPELGFGGIETAGDYGWSNEKWADLVQDIGLRTAGIHTSLDALESDAEKLVDWAKALNCHRLVVSFLPPEKRTKAGYKDAIAQMNHLGAHFREQGLQILYHNHAFEFELLPEGGCGMDIMLHEAEPGLVKFEPDVYWVEKGGLDSLDFVLSNAERVGVLHAKEIDRKTGEEAVLGTGNINFERLCQQALKHNWPVVVEYEQEGALDAVAAAARHLRPLLKLDDN